MSLQVLMIFKYLLFIARDKDLEHYAVMYRHNPEFLTDDEKFAIEAMLALAED